MDIEDLKEVLYRMSIEFVKNNNTMLGAYTYQDLLSDLHMSALRRNIIGNLQLFEAKSKDYDGNQFVEAIFQFSPILLNNEVELVYNGMRDLKWKLILPEAIDRIGNKKLEMDSEGIATEIIEQIARGQIEIMHYEELTAITKQEMIKML